MTTANTAATSKQGAKVGKGKKKHPNPHYCKMNALVQLAQIEAGLMDEGKADEVTLFMYEKGEWACLTWVSEAGQEYGIDEYVGVCEFQGRTNRQIIDQLRGMIRISRGSSERRYRETILQATHKAMTTYPEQMASISAWSSLL